MDKDRIFRQRKEMKKQAHQTVKSHYFLLVFLAAVMILFGNLYESSFGEDQGITYKTGEEEEQEEQEDSPGSILDRKIVISDIFQGKLSEGKEKSELIAKQIEEEGDISSTLGRTRGILAGVVNSFSAGKPFTMAGNAVMTIVHSEAGVAAVFIFVSLLFQVLVFVFLKNFYSAVYCRMHLEARVYETVPMGEMFHFAAVHRWAKVSWVLFVQYVYEFLWTLTVIGGVIKHYSYAMVPFIVAENPDMGANEAITLSRKMMDGHKMELFKYHVTLLGWLFLGLFTFGIGDFLYGVPYRSACDAEFYVKVRQDAADRKVPGYERLNDRYLFEKADKILLYETYFDVVDEITQIHENKVELSGFKKFVAEWFGIWLSSLKLKKQYDNQEGRIFAIRQYKLCMEGKAYPRWLNPMWEKKEIAKQGNFSFLRNYSVWTLILLFIGFSFVGWVWEVSYHFIQTGAFANRGTMFGPWLPIYGTGGVVVLLLCSRFRRNPVVEFFTAVVLCGIIEYFSGLFLEMKYHQRWWSYDGYFLNLHGRICAEGLLVFGIGCCLVVYLVAPVSDYLFSKVKTRVLIPICLVLAGIFMIDKVYSGAHPNMAEGAVEAACLTVQEGEDSTQGV